MVFAAAGPVTRRLRAEKKIRAHKESFAFIPINVIMVAL